MLSFIKICLICIIGINRLKEKFRPSWLEVGITGHIFGRGPSKDHSTKVWLQLAQWFLRRRLKCEMLTDGRRTTDDGRKVMTIAHMA